eukprot:Hpha_TRINITY_DN14611_c0_g2::TRINITY_DN14611_c0_g2_i1::g.47834::m.47834
METGESKNGSHAAPAGGGARAAAAIRRSQPDTASVRSRASGRGAGDAQSVATSLQYPGASVTSSQALAQLRQIEEELAAERKRRLNAEKTIEKLVLGGKKPSECGSSRQGSVNKGKESGGLLPLTEDNLRAMGVTAAPQLPPPPPEIQAPSELPERTAAEAQKKPKSKMKPPVYKGGVAPVRGPARRKRVGEAEVWLHNQRKANNELRFLFRDNWG